LGPSTSSGSPRRRGHIGRHHRKRRGEAPRPGRTISPVDGSVSEWDLLAASLRADTADLQSYLEGLATKLEAGFPGRVRVERRGGGLFGGKKRVASVVVRLGDREYVLENSDEELSCGCRTIVRGVALKTERLSLREWTDRLAADLLERAGQSESDRLAIEKLLGIGT